MWVCKEEHAPEMKVCRLEGKASHSCWYHAKIEAHFDASRLIELVDHFLILAGTVYAGSANSLTYRTGLVSFVAKEGPSVHINGSTSVATQVSEIGQVRLDK